MNVELETGEEAFAYEHFEPKLALIRASVLSTQL